ncbi:MAG: hypothetical protein Q7R47_00175, partial [Candidatus Diapherotrites archaeon]|nr:hypothetical protein [Candidatus Diapherotrites archaeon]
NAAFDLQWFRMAKGNGISIVVALDDVWSTSGAARMELLKFWLQAAKLSEKAGNRLRVITGARRIASVRSQADLAFVSNWLAAKRSSA